MSHDPQHSNERPTWVRWQIVALLVGYSFMTWFNRVSMPVAYDERISRQTDISPEAMGWVYSSFLFFYMVFMTPGGWLIDRFGGWKSLVVMGFGSAAFCALTGAAGRPVLLATGTLFWILIVIRSVMGMFTAPIYPAAARMVANWMPLGQRALANGLVQAAAAVGIACTYHLFGSLIDLIDWQNAFLVTGGITALLTIAWTVYAADRPERHKHVNDAERRLITGQGWQATTAGGPATVEEADPNGEPRPTTRSIVLEPPWHTLLLSPNLLLLTLSYAAIGYVEYLFFFWMHYYFRDVLNLPAGESRTYAMILNLSLAAGMILGGGLADWARRSGGRWSRAAVPAVGLLAGGVFLILGVLATDINWIVAFLALALGAVGATEAPTWTLAVELGGRYGGTAAAICNTGGNAGGLIAPILTPLASGLISRHFDVSEQVGWQWGISLGSAIAVLGAILWIWITPAKAATDQHS